MTANKDENNDSDETPRDLKPEKDPKGGSSKPNVPITGNPDPNVPITGAPES